MDCSKCDRDAVLHQAYSGSHLCEQHFRESVARRVKRRIRKDGMIGEASPESPERWVIGLSGGKDSVVLATILADTFGRDPRIDLVCLSIHEGIDGYRDESLEASRQVTESLDLPHEVVTYDDELDLRMDDIVAEGSNEMAPCAYCGVFRRDVLERYARRLDADKLFTGHNLDDEAQTAMMNLFEGDVEQMAKHYDASLAPFEDRSGAPFVPRAKPLRDVPEKEIALYARLADLPAHIAECPHANEAYRGEIRDVLLAMEERHPGTRHSVMAGYEELAALAAERYKRNTETALSSCANCGAKTTREICRKCSLVEAVIAD